ncbi:hypothetical protein ARMGADRAFT_1099403, partial [Armillaria gallica]
MVQGTPMLMFGKVGSSGRGNGHGIMVLGTFVAPSSRPSKPKRACPSLSLSSLCAAGVPIFILPSSLMSPTLQHVPSTLSFPSIPPLDRPIAPQWSVMAPTHVVVVAIVSLVVVVMSMCTFGSPSHAEITADVESQDAAYTLVAPMSMPGVLMLPPLRAYMGGGGRIYAIQGSWGRQMHGKKLKSN